MKPTETFAHACKHCGKCCQYRGDIYLTPWDVLRMAQHLGITSLDFVQLYCERKEKIELALKANGPKRTCIFLKKAVSGTYCQIYKIRPMACYLFPLKASLKESSQIDFTINQHPYCPVTKKQQKIAAYVANSSNNRFSEEFLQMHMWCAFLEMYEEGLTDEEEEMIFEFLYSVNTAQEIYEKLANFL